VTRDTIDLLHGNVALLEQGLELLEHLADPAYRDTPPGRSSIGAQYRHILDHYRALLDGMALGRVDYDARRRNPEVERDRAVAARDTRDLIARLRLLAGRSRGTPLTVHAACTADHAGETQRSSLGRELLFLTSHTVHHFAIIRLLLEDPAAVAPEFGTAPSTIAWRRAAR
jgi:uncharacterized damage-inducible protein DinB